MKHSVNSAHGWHKSLWYWGTAVACAFLFAILTTQSAKAHSRVEVGPYALVVGWLTEPPLVGERNAITIEISQIADEQPVTDAEGGLDVELLYGAQTFRTNLNPTTTPGLYTADIFPTVRGQYSIRLFGTLGDTEIDEVLEPEEVFPAERLQFPEPAPDTRELQAQIVELYDTTRALRWQALAGISIGVLGIITAVVAFVRARKPTS